MKKCFIFLMFLVILTLLCFSATKIVLWFLDNGKNQEIKEKIKHYVVNDDVSFSDLKKINSDTLAYLKMDDFFEYAVVRGSDNSYYLNHNFNKESNQAGWIFMDFRNKFDGTDKNIIIYGHNMLDGSMFGSLIRLLDTKNDNLHIKLISESAIFYYQVFSVYKIKPEDYYIKTDFSDNSFSDFINTIKSRSKYDFNLDVSSSDNVLTLSTCSFDGSERVVIHFKLINTKNTH